MATNSTIEWTHHTFNPWRGCTKVSPGCVNCYADTMSKRNPKMLGVWGRHGSRVVAVDAYWRQAERWNAAALAAGERHRVFCASLADVFEGPESMPDAAWPLVEAARARLWALIEATPALDWLLLTKRPENAAQNCYTPITWWERWPANVWIGTSVEDQKRADERIPQLLRVPARVRFLSCEPLLGPVSLKLGYGVAGEPLGVVRSDMLHWVICGGESGHGARPMHPDWARGLRDQCQAAGVSFFFKQWGEWLGFERVRVGESRQYIAGDGRRIYALDLIHKAHEVHNDVGIIKLGKKAAGRTLDGRTWDEYPQEPR